MKRMSDRMMVKAIKNLAAQEGITDAAIDRQINYYLSLRTVTHTQLDDFHIYNGAKALRRKAV